MTRRYAEQVYAYVILSLDYAFWCELFLILHIVSQGRSV